MLMTLSFQGRISQIAHSLHHPSRLVKQQEKSSPSRWEARQALTASQMIRKQQRMRRQSGIFSWEVLVAHVLLARLFWMGNNADLPKESNVRSNYESSIDMDIEGGSQTGFVSFLTALRSLMNGGNKPYAAHCKDLEFAF
jgi:hypothetical protein